MTVEKDCDHEHPKIQSKGSSSGLRARASTSYRGLLRTVFLVLLGLILVMTMESSFPLSFFVFPSDSTNAEQFHLGEGPSLSTHSISVNDSSAIAVATENALEDGNTVFEEDPEGEKLAAGITAIYESTPWEVDSEAERNSAGFPILLDGSNPSEPEHKAERTFPTLDNPSKSEQRAENISLVISTSNERKPSKARHEAEKASPTNPTSDEDSAAEIDFPNVFSTSDGKTLAEVGFVVDQKNSSVVPTPDKIRLSGSGSSHRNRKQNDSAAELCDFTRGSWVKDDGRRPFYSGKTCNAYLAGGWACRLMRNRTDFEYENFRWQPDGCDLPSFDANAMLQRLKNKVVTFIGDSLGREQFQSLMCMLTSGESTRPVESVNRQWAKNLRWAYRFLETNTTIMFYWSSCLCEIEYGLSTEKDGWAAMHLDRPDTFLKAKLHLFDLLILNTGHHWNRGKLAGNKWHPYLNGKPLKEPELAGIDAEMNFTVFKLVHWLDEQLSKTPDEKHKPTVFFKTLSPRHFRNGEWDSGGTCDGTRASATIPEAPSVKHSGFDKATVAMNAVRGTSVHLLNITFLSNFREDGHVSRFGAGRDYNHQDCLHWCLPGVPDVWNELLFGYLVADQSINLNYNLKHLT